MMSGTCSPNPCAQPSGSVVLMGCARHDSSPECATAWTMFVAQP
jgi:hypothetical protein